jgi:hypothetical protein
MYKGQLKMSEEWKLKACGACPPGEPNNEEVVEGEAKPSILLAWPVHFYV